MTPRSKTYRSWDPEAYALLQYSPSEHLPEGDLVFFLLDLIPQLDLTPFYASYEVETRGQPPFDPAKMVTLIVYAYCVGLFSSRKIALACQRNLAFLAIAGDDPPNFRTISDFRKEHLGAFADLFVRIVEVAAEAGLLSLGNIAFDGSKFKANASRHKAMSYGYMKKEKARLKQEIEALLQKANGTDTAEDAALGARRGDELPQELERREQRLATIQGAMERLEEQAKADAQEQEQRRAEAEAERQRQGKKRRGKQPKPVSAVPAEKAQTSFTDPESKMMPQNNKGWDFSGNAQISVDEKCQIILAAFVTDASNDSQQAVPLAEATLATLEAAGVALPCDEHGEVRPIPMTADTGFFSAEAVPDLEARGFDPYLATKRDKHNQVQPAVVSEALANAATPAKGEPSPEASAASVPSPAANAAVDAPQASGSLSGQAIAAVLSVVAAVASTAAAAANGVAAAVAGTVAAVLNTASAPPESPPQVSGPSKATPAAKAREAMAAKLKTEQGKKLYARRKVIVEPVFGQIKAARGFRHFSVRGLEKMKGEWQLVCLTHNLLKIWRYRVGLKTT